MCPIDKYQSDNLKPINIYLSKGKEELIIKISDKGGGFSRDNMNKPYAEPEISFRVREDIDISKAPYSIDNIKNLIDGILCSIEIVDFRFDKPLNEIGAINFIYEWSI